MLTATDRPTGDATPPDPTGIDYYTAPADPAVQAEVAWRPDPGGQVADARDLDRAVYAYRAALQLYGGPDRRTITCADMLTTLLRDHGRRPAAAHLVATPALDADQLAAGPDALAAARYTVAELLQTQGFCLPAVREATAALRQRVSGDPQPTLATALLLVRAAQLLTVCGRTGPAISLLDEHRHLLPSPAQPWHGLAVDFAGTVLGNLAASERHRRVCTLGPDTTTRRGGTARQRRIALDVRAHLLGLLTVTARHRPGTAPVSPARQILQTELAARYTTSQISIGTLAGEAGYSYTVVQKMLTAADVTFRSPGQARRDSTLAARIGYLSTGRPPTGPSSEDYDTSIRHALRELGHYPTPLAPAPSTFHPHGLGALLVLCWQPPPQRHADTVWWQHLADSPIPVLLWDPLNQLPDTHPLHHRPQVRVLDARTSSRYSIDAPALPIPHTYLDRHQPRTLIARRRTGRHLTVTNPIRQPPDLAGYRNALTVYLPADTGNPATTHASTIHLITAVTAGCLPVTDPDSPLAALIPTALHAPRDPADLTGKLAWLNSIGTTSEHRDLIAATRLRLYRNAITGILQQFFPNTHTGATRALTAFDTSTSTTSRPR
ncbi:helix-turn-helix domain-containing protein [Actinoplanes sp. NPDC000266]